MIKAVSEQKDYVRSAANPTINHNSVAVRVGGRKYAAVQIGGGKYGPGFGWHR
jgi:hypothetical protein